MTLGPDYLCYPRRRLGYDHDLFAFSATPHRPGIAWPGGRALAVWPVITAEFFPLTPVDRPFRAPGHMQTAFPDYRHFTARDYGSRVGIFRLLDAFEVRGLAATVAMNVALAERAPALLRAVVEGGHEIMAHSTDMNGTIDGSLAVADEDSLIAGTRARWAALGHHPKGFHAIARSQSFRTPDLLVKHGFTFTCDWVNDDQPWRFANGLWNLPLNHELSDRQIINQLQASAESWAEQVADAATCLAAEGGRVLALELTPYILGLPYRIGAVEELLDRLLPMAWFASAEAILEAFADQARVSSPTV
ncbi:polysaccharide deacetylase family protein [Thermaurantiacus sp.]